MAEFIVDLHLHSQYSRAVSKDMNLEAMSHWAARKGITVLACADYTHPAWYAELKEKLQLQENGLYRLKNAPEQTFFILSTELSCIYSQDGGTRRIHIVVVFPTLLDVATFNASLKQEGANLRADGRPILGMSAERIVELAKMASPESIIIPAHIWTPWFSMFGSMSGFDSVAECFGKQTQFIKAVETGLSSDPAMNWRLSQLDGMQIVSFSDAHSAKKMAREATVLNLDRLTYANLRRALESPDVKNSIAYTIEFYPEEGKYHFDGHRDCDIRLSPAETKKHRGVCPKCKKPVTVGVMNRVDELADRPEGYRPKNRPPFKSIVPLQEIIADAFGVGVNSKRVQTEFDTIIDAIAPEFEVLLNTDLEKIASAAQPIVVEGIRRVRQGALHILPGYDGEFGTVSVFTDEERAAAGTKQKTLF